MEDVWAHLSAGIIDVAGTCRRNKEVGSGILVEMSR